jgi:hypothetical protein
MPTTLQKGSKSKIRNDYLSVNILVDRPFIPGAGILLHGQASRALPAALPVDG